MSQVMQNSRHSMLRKLLTCSLESDVCPLRVVCIKYWASIGQIVMAPQLLQIFFKSSAKSLLTAQSSSNSLDSDETKLNQMNIVSSILARFRIKLTNFTTTCSNCWSLFIFKASSSILLIYRKKSRQKESCAQQSDSFISSRAIRISIIGLPQSIICCILLKASSTKISVN